MRDINYATKTLDELIKIYASESTRHNKEDAHVTQSKVVSEVYYRIKATFAMLDEEPGNADNIYKQLINF